VKQKLPRKRGKNKKGKKEEEELSKKYFISDFLTAIKGFMSLMLNFGDVKNLLRQGLREEAD